MLEGVGRDFTYGLFLFTDIEGSSRLWEVHPASMAEALARHDALLREAVEAHGGYVVKTTGDGVLAAFATASDALAAAIAGQLALAGANWGATGPLRVRMGVHTGESVHQDGDYHGPALNRTARLMSAGHGGQVLVSTATAALVRDGLAEGAELVALGEHRLRDLGRPEGLYQLTHPGLARDFPALRTLDSYPGNLPLQVSSFIGRDREVSRAIGALQEARLVTLTGVGGVGKTRLALQVAAAVLPGFRDGAWLVELAPVRDPGGIPGAIAAVFGVAARAGLSLEESLVDFLRTKQVLLVLDNCEHLLDPVAATVEVLERACGGLELLATSREGLALEGERLLPVPSLAAPATHASAELAAGSDAVRLFVERAGAVDPDFVLTANNAADVVQICQRLDGIPLAIELAAARIAAMSPAELARGLDRRFMTLAGGRRGAVQRHQTLRGAMDWSYDLLSDGERRLLARLSVFAGGCSRSAVEAICGPDPLGPAGVFDLIASLVAKSLVVAQRGAPETRYRLLETLREYGEERLAEYGETQELRGAHAEYYCARVGAVTDQVLGAGQIEAGRGFLPDNENLLAAMNHALESTDVDLAMRIVVNATPPPGQVGYVFLLPIEPVLTLPGAADHPLYPLCLATSAFQAALQGELTDLEATCNEALAAAKRVWSATDHRVEQLVLGVRANEAMVRGRWEESASYREQGAELARSDGRLSAMSFELGSAAMCHTMGGNADAAVPMATEGLEIARRGGIPTHIAMNLLALAGALADREPSRARTLLDEAIHLGTDRDLATLVHSTQSPLVAARIGDWPLVLKVASNAIGHLHWSGDRPMLAGVINLVARGTAYTDPAGAAVLQGAARRLASDPHAVVPSPAGREPSRTDRSTSDAVSFVTEIRRQTTAILRQSLSDVRLRELREDGEAMDEDQAVAHALDLIGRVRAENSF
jgi:predicted ATPase/class 3 adenylate cyclase